MCCQSCLGVRLLEQDGNAIEHNHYITFVFLDYFDKNQRLVSCISVSWVISIITMMIKAKPTIAPSIIITIRNFILKEGSFNVSAFPRNIFQFLFMFGFEALRDLPQQILSHQGLFLDFVIF